MKRVLIPIDSYEPESWSFALAYAIRICEVNEKEPNVVLVVDTMHQVSSTSLSRFIGEQQIKVLKSKRQLSLNGGRLRLETLQTLSYVLQDAVVIAFYASEKLLDKVEDVKGLSGIVAVPWNQGELDSWADRWGVIIHGEKPRPQAKILTDPVVERALLELVRMVNSSTGIGNPRDKSMANETLRILRNKGHQFDAEEIRSWALQQGWRSQQANDLGTLAAKISCLKTKPRLSEFHDPDSRYKRWSS